MKYAVQIINLYSSHLGEKKQKVSKNYGDTYWVTKEGDTIKISDLTDSHINAILRYFQDKEIISGYMMKRLRKVHEEKIKRGI